MRIFTRFLCLSFIILSNTPQLIAQAKSSIKPKTATKAVSPKDANAAAEPWKQSRSSERLVEITTDYGVMIAKLYDSTPLHRDNFIKLVQQGFYDSLLFHRVVDKFMIQGGDPASKYAADGAALGNGAAPGDRIPSEFKPYLFHKKGALAAARDDNPQKSSSNCQFYIVDGKTVSDNELNDIYIKRVKSANPNFTWSVSERETYNRIGGTPFLDQSYTVFGEVISGLDVIDKIASVAKDAANRPLQNVRMKMRMLN